MNKYIIVGAGGTGSYFLNNLIHYLKSSTSKKHEILLIDGDILEDRNLLRQGFLKQDINKNKSEVLVNRFNKILPKNIILKSKSSYIERMEDLYEDLDPNKENVIISCVDNNMARLRILVAQYRYFYDYGKTITFIDGGNEEWEGQTLVNTLVEGKEPPILFTDQLEYKEVKGHQQSNIFDNNPEWKRSLTKGDFEISCDVITESAPQNILANMTSATGLIRRVHDLKNVRYQFNIKSGVQEEYAVNKESRIPEIVKYINEDIWEEIFKDKTDEIKYLIEED